MTLDEIKVLSGIPIVSVEKKDYVSILEQEEYQNQKSKIDKQHHILNEHFDDIFLVIEKLNNITTILKDLKNEYNIDNLAFNLTNDNRLKQTRQFILTTFLNSKDTLDEIEIDLKEYKSSKLFETREKTIKKEYLIISNIDNVNIIEDKKQVSNINLHSGFLYLLENNTVVIKNNNKYILTDITKDQIDKYDTDHIII